MGLSSLVEKLHEHDVTVVEISEEEAPDFEQDETGAAHIIARVKETMNIPVIT